MLFTTPTPFSPIRTIKLPRVVTPIKKEFNDLSEKERWQYKLLAMDLRKEALISVKNNVQSGKYGSSQESILIFIRLFQQDERPTSLAYARSKKIELALFQNKIPIRSPEISFKKIHETERTIEEWLSLSPRALPPTLEVIDLHSLGLVNSSSIKIIWEPTPPHMPQPEPGHSARQYLRRRWINYSPDTSVTTRWGINLEKLNGDIKNFIVLHSDKRSHLEKIDDCLNSCLQFYKDNREGIDSGQLHFEKWQRFVDLLSIARGVSQYIQTTVKRNSTHPLLDSKDFGKAFLRSIGQVSGIEPDSNGITWLDVYSKLHQIDTSHLAIYKLDDTGNIQRDTDENILLIEPEHPCTDFHYQLSKDFQKSTSPLDFTERICDTILQHCCNSFDVVLQIRCVIPDQ